MSVRDGARVVVYAYGIQPEVFPTGDSLIIGHSQRGQIGAFAGNRVRNHTGTSSTTWRGMEPTDLSCFVTEVSITRGRRRSLDSFPAGSMTLGLEASDQRFDPLFSNKIYNGGVGRQLFRKGTPIVCAVTGGGVSGVQALFSGFVDSIRYSYNLHASLYTATVTCVDAFDLLARVDLNEADQAYGANETMGQRINRWLEVAGWHQSASGSFDPWTPTTNQVGPFPSRRYGAVEYQPGTWQLQATRLSENALTAIKAAAASSDGYVFVDAIGRVAWGTDRTISAFDPTFGDFTTTTTAAFTSCRPVLDVDDFANVFQFARVGGVTQTGVAADIDNEQRVEFNRTDLLNTSNTDVKGLVDLMAARHGTPPVNCTIDIDPWSHDNAFLAAASLDLVDRVRWQWSAVGIDRYGFVSGIEHQIRPGVDWSASYFITERL